MLHRVLPAVRHQLLGIAFWLREWPLLAASGHAQPQGVGMMDSLHYADLRVTYRRLRVADDVEHPKLP